MRRNWYHSTASSASSLAQKECFLFLDVSSRRAALVDGSLCLRISSALIII